ncbi:MAG: YdcF family protein [Cyanophyceae cyanobacterium]
MTGTAFLLASIFVHSTVILWLNSSKPVDALLVLGGSIQREIHAAQLAKQYPELPIVISQGADDPCVFLIFQREQARLDKVWLERCADSTFGNFFFGIPILRRLDVHKVKVVTSATHLPRAKWLAQILLGAHGIWVEPEIVTEKGVPGNQESVLKTGLDVLRSLLWSPLSQAIYPPCSRVTQLEDVDLQAWQENGFQCERQGNIQAARPSTVSR